MKINNVSDSVYTILTAWGGICLLLIVVAAFVYPAALLVERTERWSSAVAWTVRALLVFVWLPVVTGLLMGAVYGYSRLVGWPW